eukprot:CAMPEP_0183357324 /NCGR_PEP_ID=MMETSP0164_2-20130417/45907_1 /TAXON_ID=221442 /ORGANISM="Coccolithus pelagicus ssp braarudi, Strain PLY182g" /LENGTH=316 /DNA_ID=CAMNT_0025530913 /DNA_START=79 /DNA_END=1029 /DNA_ORIENTATION=-
MAVELEAILRNLCKRKDALHFAEPVNWQQHKLFNYPELIKQPMDLGTVQETLQLDTARDFADKKYQFAEDFAHDVRLVWKNAFIFNAPGHDVFKAAKNLAGVFEDRLSALYSKLDEEAPPVSPVSRCQILVSDMCANCLSEWFRRDDWKQFGEHYLVTIKSGRPMDLFAVQAWLDEQPQDGGDQVVAEFAERVRLIFSNAIDYNGSFTWVGTVAKILSDTFDRRLELLQKAPRPPPMHPPLEEREGWPSYEQKERLFSYVTHLSLRDSSMLAAQVQKRCPTAVLTCDREKERVTIALDKVDLETFTHMDALRKQKQ